jgi:hypothetical protein
MKSPRRPYKRNIAKLRHTQGCLTDCVAYFLNLHPQHVPLFIYPRLRWCARLKAFLRKHGWEARWIKCDAPPSRGVTIVCGDSLKWKTACHCVVYRAGRLAFDPLYPSKWRDNRITHRLILTRIEG